MRKYSWSLLLLSAFVYAADTIPLQKQDAPADEEAAEMEKASGSGAGPGSGQAAQDSPEKGEVRPYVASIDTYGSTRITEDLLRKLLGKELDTWVKKGLAADPTAMDLEKKFIKKVKAKYSFPFAEFSIIQYFQPGDMALHITLDVVETKDAARRMPFIAEPKEVLSDPGGLIAQWQEYERTALGLVESGELEPESEKCVALHCPFGHKHAKLKKFEKIFVEGVKKYSDALLKVQKNDHRPEYRAASSYLLAYWVDGKKQVVEAMLDRLKDPDALVRNNSLRVLGDIAEFHTDVIVPIAPIIPALDFPKVSDRSKALYVAFLLASNSAQVREALMKSSVPTLFALMECHQPDHRELAHGILRKLSGKDFSETDNASWMAWYKKASQGREISKKD